MDNTNSSTPLWKKVPDKYSNPIVEANSHADVCIVGAGISGLTTAYLLSLEGKRVMVLDRGPLASGESSRTTAHLSNAIDKRYCEIESLHGDRGATLVAESHTAAISLIEWICQREKIDCSFERLDGYLFVPEGDSEDILDRELSAAHRAGLLGVRRCKSLPVPTLSQGICLKFPNQGQMHPTKYLEGLAEGVVAHGGEIYTGISVTNIEGGPIATIRSSDGALVTADAAVVATNTPINDRVVIHTKQAAYRTYVIGFRVKMGSIPKALYWDTADPYHYIRLHTQGNREYLVVGGEDHRTGQSNDERECYGRLEEWALKHFTGIDRPEFRWSGQIEKSMDGLAYIGRNPSDFPNVYVATGDSGMGMTHGTIAGRLITDLIMGYKNPWESLYDPSRKNFVALRAWIKENTNSAIQYGDYLTAGDIKSLDELPLGEGAIFRTGIDKVAVYRDSKGERHYFSSICPHLGGIVHWNTAEKTWDCPCHGSRFSVDGEVIQGPAISGLKPIEVVDRPKKEPSVDSPPRRVA